MELTSDVCFSSLTQEPDRKCNCTRGCWRKEASLIVPGVMRARAWEVVWRQMQTGFQRDCGDDNGQDSASPHPSQLNLG